MSNIKAKSQIETAYFNKVRHLKASDLLVLTLSKRGKSISAISVRYFGILYQLMRPKLETEKALGEQDGAAAHTARAFLNITK